MIPSSLCLYQFREEEYIQTEDGRVLKCVAAGSRWTAPSQWAARYRSVISPKSLFFWLTDKFAQVTVFTAQGGSSSVQNPDPLREIRRDALSSCMLKNEHKNTETESWIVPFKELAQMHWLTIPCKRFCNKIIALQAVFSPVSGVMLFTGSINFVIHVCWMLKKMLSSHRKSFKSLYKAVRRSVATK